MDGQHNVHVYQTVHDQLYCPVSQPQHQPGTQLNQLASHRNGRFWPGSGVEEGGGPPRPPSLLLSTSTGIDGLMGVIYVTVRR